MKLKRLSAALSAMLVFGCISERAQLPQSSHEDLKPYTLDFAHHTSSDIDLDSLVPGPAGKGGFVHVQNGHLVTADGERLRLWGVNMSGWTDGSMLVPAKPEAKLVAKTLRHLGVNAVRYMFLDFPDRQVDYSRAVADGYTGTASNRPEGMVDQTPEGLLDVSGGTTQVMSPEMLDRLDYFIYQLKENGIYVNFNLNVDHRYEKGDGVHGYNLIGPAKAITYFDPKLIEYQKEYAKQLLTHYNPYTKTEYRNEPAIAILQIINENSVLEFWERNWIRGNLKPGVPRFQLDMTPFHKRLLTQKFNNWLSATYNGPQLQHLRLLEGLKPGEPFFITQRQDFSRTPNELFYAEVNFFCNLERGFMQDMRSYLRSLGAKQLIVGTNDHTYFISGLPLLRTQQMMDIIDAHAYWQHPAIYGKRDMPMVNDPLHSIIVKLTRSVMQGKPFIVSEYNEPYPTDYAEEVIPIMAAYGALQDWDGIFIYCFEPRKDHDPSHEFIHDYFDITQNPVMMAQMPVGSLMFLRHDVETAKQTVERTYSAQQVDESARLPDSEDPYYTPGFPLSVPIEHASRIRCVDCKPSQKFSDTPANPIISDTRQLAWSTSEKSGGFVTVDTDRSTAVIGFVRQNKGHTSHLVPEVQNDFCAITLSSLDGKPISVAARLLLTATGRVENTGSTWQLRHTMFEQWGAMPTRIEPIKGYVLLKRIDGAVGMIVSPLDGAGKPLGEIRGRRLEAGWEFSVGGTVTTSYFIRIVR